MGTTFTSQVKANTEEETSVQWEHARRQMHQAIDERNHVQVQQCLETVRNLKLWLHPITEESALYRAVENNAFHIYALLHASNCRFKDDKERECIDEGNLNDVQRSEIRRQQEFVRRPKDAHLSNIKNAIRVQSVECKENIANMIDNLDSDELLSVILKVVAVSPDLKVIVDSDEEDIQTLVGCQAGGMLFGLTFVREGKIFVGGKRQETTEKASQSEVRGTLLHEMCHLALHLVYNNDGKPYCSPDIERRRSYLEIIEEMKNSENLDPIIRWAFEDKRKIEEELIVRVPHIIAKHFDSEEGISILQDQVPKLFLFFKDNVIPDMKKYVEDACPGMDARRIREENVRLGKAKRTDDLEVIFEKPMRHQDLEDVPLLILTSPDLALMEIVVHNAVKSKGHPYLFFEATQWDDTVQDVLRDNKCNVILLTCNEETDFKEKLYLLSEVSKVVGTRVILLVPEKDKAHFSKQVENDSYFGKNPIVHDVSLASSFENITRECKDDVRKKSFVQFQGSEYEIQLADVVDLENFLSCIDTRAFLELCETRYVDVGPTLRKQEKDVSGYYVARTLQGRLKFDARKLHEDSRDEAFIFYGCPKETVKKFLPRDTLVEYGWGDKFHKFVLISDAEVYNIIRENDHYRNKTLHLLEYCGTESDFGRITSKATGSDFPFVEVVYYNEEYLMNELEEKVVIICGEPGMGKSALADWISVKFKDAEKKRWVIHINLSEKHIPVPDDEIGTDVESLQKLAILFGVKTDGLDFLLFQRSVQNGAPFEIVIIFDAFDEANEQSRINTFKLVNLLRETRISKIYIISRSIFKQSIEDSITADEVPLELAPLWYSDITEFMKKHWRANGANHLTDEELHSEAMETMRSYEMEFGNNKEVLRNPLLLKIICELEQSSLFDRKATADARRCRSLFQVYTMFAEYKHRIYAEEKLSLNLDSSSAAAQHENEKRRKEFYDTLGLLALLVILGKELIKVLFADKLKDLDEEGSLMKEVADNLRGYGLVEGLSEGKARFIHRTFAEFFAAHFLFNEVKTIGTDNPDLMKFVLDMYGKYDYRQVIYFLDGFASASFPLHSSIINGEYSSLCSIDEKAMEIADEFGRTLLHVAAVHGKKKYIWNILPINADSLEVKDKFGVTPIMYADKCGSDFVLDKFCFLHSDEDIEWAKKIPVTFENVTNEKDLKKSVLLESVCNNYCSLLNVILSRFCRKRGHSSFDSVNPRPVDVDTIRNLEKRTVLFYAESKAVCELLLPYCDIRAVDQYGNTPLHYAILWSTQFPFCLHAFEVVQFYFLRLPVDVIGRGLGTPLHVSIRKGNPDVVKLLLLRSRTDVTDEFGFNATGEAFQYYKPDIINLVLPNSFIVHRKDVSTFFYPLRYTELWWLSDRVHEDEILVSIYHSPKTMRQIRPDPDKEYTCQELFQAMFPYLNIDDESDFRLRFVRRHFRKEQPRLVPLKQLLIRFDVSSTDEDGGSALHQCAQWGCVDELKLLLPHSNTSGRDREGRTALEVASTKHGAEHELSRTLLRWSRKSINIGEEGQEEWRKKMKWALLYRCMIC